MIGFQVTNLGKARRVGAVDTKLRVNGNDGRGRSHRAQGPGSEQKLRIGETDWTCVGTPGIIIIVDSKALESSMASFFKERVHSL